MSTRTLLAVTLFSVFATAANAALVRHAGEWQTSINNQPPMISCFATDKTLDQQTIMRPLTQLPGASCKLNSMTTAGPVTSYSMQCTISGSVMNTSGTVVATGPDAFTSKMHSHGGVIQMGSGKAMAMPDNDMTIVSHRLGPCKPGDRVNPY